MTVEIPGFDVVIKVNRSLLNRVLDVMDGRNPFGDIVIYEHYPEWNVACRVAGKLQDIIEEGVVSVGPHDSRRCSGMSTLDPELESP